MGISHQPLLAVSVAALSVDFLWSLVLKTAAPWHSFRSPSPCFSSLVCHPAFCLYSDLQFCLLSSCLLTLPFLHISLILLPQAFCHGPSLEFFSCSFVSRLPLPLPRWLLSPPEPLACLCNHLVLLHLLFVLTARATPLMMQSKRGKRKGHSGSLLLVLMLQLQECQRRGCSGWL